MQVFHAPAVFDQFGGEPVQQFGMRGGRSLAPELENRGDQWLPEMTGPEVIDRHSGRQGILGIGDPIGQGATAPRTMCREGRRGIIRAGAGEVNESLVTGESIPIARGEGDRVIVYSSAQLEPGARVRERKVESR